MPVISPVRLVIPIVVDLAKMVDSVVKETPVSVIMFSPNVVARARSGAVGKAPKGREGAMGRSGATESVVMVTLASAGDKIINHDL